MKFCRVCSAELIGDSCPVHGDAQRGPVDIEPNEKSRAEDKMAIEERPRKPAPKKGGKKEGGLFVPDMTVVKQKKKFRDHQKNQPPQIIQLDRDLQERFIDLMETRHSLSYAPERPKALVQGSSYCGACGHPITNQDDRFCRNCGASISQDDEEPATPIQTINPPPPPTANAEKIRSS